MRVGHLLQLGDVAVDPDTVRKVARKALFFLPEALGRAGAAGINDANLNLRSKILKDAGDLQETVGRDVVEKVMQCRPVSYPKAMGFMEVINAELSLWNSRRIAAGAEDAALPLFKESDWVSCIFRLRDAPDILNALDIDEAALASGSSVPLDVVSGAVADKNRYCITLADGLAIWTFLKTAKTAATLAPDQEAALSAVTEDPRDLLATDDKYLLAVRTVAGARRDDPERYVYGRDHLRPAPPTGHPWALEALSSEPAATG